MIVDWLKNMGFKSLKWTIVKAAGLSYWIALVMCIMAVLLYAVGIEKGKKLGLGSFIIFILLQCMKGMM